MYEHELCDPQADVSVTEAGWHAAIALPAQTTRIRLKTDQEVYCVLNRSSGDPAQTGAAITPGVHHELVCRGASHLHLKKVGANATVTWTAVRAALS